MAELAEAAQIIKLMYDGIEMGFKAGLAGIGAIRKGIQLLVLWLDREKLLGKTTLKDMLKQGGELQVFRFDKRDYKEFQKLAKQYGVLFSEIPQTDKNSKTMEVFFQSDSISRMNMVMQRLSTCKIVSYDGYLSGMSPADMDKLIDVLKGQNAELAAKVNSKDPDVMKTAEKYIKAATQVQAKTDAKSDAKTVAAKELGAAGVEAPAAEKSVKQNTPGRTTQGGSRKESENKKTNVKVDAYSRERVNAIRNRIIALSKSSDDDLVGFTFPKSRITAESPNYYVVRVPGAENRFIWLDKKDMLESENSKELISFFDRNKDYALVDQTNKVADRLKGQELNDRYSDIVKQTEAELKEALKSKEHDAEKGRRDQRPEKNTQSERRNSAKDRGDGDRNGNRVSRDQHDGKATTRKRSSSQVVHTAKSGKSR